MIRHICPGNICPGGKCPPYQYFHLFYPLRIQFWPLGLFGPLFCWEKNFNNKNWLWPTFFGNVTIFFLHLKGHSNFLDFIEQRKKEKWYDWNCRSLNVKTRRLKVLLWRQRSRLRPRLELFTSQCRDRDDWNIEPYRDRKILWLSRLRLDKRCRHCSLYQDSCYI